MTREEAIQVFQDKIDNRPLFKDEREAFDMAIEALSAEAVHKPDYSYEADMVRRLKESLSAEAVPQSDQNKRGFKDDKRAFLIEYARESENMRKRNAQLEVMLNAQKAISAESEWIPCSERLPNEDECGWYLVTVKGHELFVDVAPFDDALWKGLGSNQEVIAWMPLPEPYKAESEEV